MTRQLRGTRYRVEGSKQSEDLADFIVNDLHKLDYESTIDFYLNAVPHIDALGRALLGANDRYFLLTQLMGRIDAFHPWLFARCREVEKEPDGYLDLWARYHYKSTIITFTGVIQEVIDDPEVTICILSNIKPVAQKFLGQIKKELENNIILKTLYSDVFWQNPRREAPVWALDAGLIVKRLSNPKEATIEAHGLVDSQPVGMHYDVLAYDDIVTDKSITPDQIRKTTTQLENSDNLGKPGGTKKWMAGTRWSFGDTYGQIVDDGRVKTRIYPATKDGTLKGEPVFLTRERWAEIKDWQKSTVSAQMLLNPVAGSEAVFQTSWFRPYEVFPPIMNVYILCDPSKGKKRGQNDSRPDRTAIAVIGIDPAGNKYLLDGFRHRMRMSARYNCIKSLREKWSSHRGVQFVKVGYERYGAQIDTEVIEDLQERDGEYFEVHELGTPREGPESKNARIERLEPDLRDSRFFLPAVVYKPEFSDKGGMCLWSVWTKEDDDNWRENARLDIAKELNSDEAAIKKRYEDNPPIPPYEIGKILYRPLRGLTRMQRFHAEAGQHHRVVKAIRRIDEDKNVYDVTVGAMEEFRLHPFAPHDDFIDAASRLYDIEPVAPEQFEVQAEPYDEDAASQDLYDA